MENKKPKKKKPKKKLDNKLVIEKVDKTKLKPVDKIPIDEQFDFDVDIPIIESPKPITVGIDNKVVATDKVKVDKLRKVTVPRTPESKILKRKRKPKLNLNTIKKPGRSFY